MQYYKVFNYDPREKNVSWQDVLFNFEMKEYYGRQNTTNQTITMSYNFFPAVHEDRRVTCAMIIELHKFNAKYADLFAQAREKLYHSYKIPKRSGGLRPIDEPLPPLKAALTELSEMIQCWGNFHHAAAYAYVENRCTLDALRMHQRFQSQYYLKTDLTNFFGSTTEKFALKQIMSVMPFASICRTTCIYETETLDGLEELKKALSLGFLRGGLPQGSPLSPFLTNLIMIPIDHALMGRFSSRKLVYTRYADDMLISGREKFPWRDMVKMINDAFVEFEAPYRINDEKTRFGSVRGSNFNLGLCTNANNDITVGYKNKKTFKAMVNNFILDRKKGINWEIGDVQHMAGLFNYYRQVEPEYFDKLIDRYNAKYHCNFKRMVRDCLNLRW